MRMGKTYVAALGLRLRALAADVAGLVAVVATLAAGATGGGASGRGAVAGKVTDTTAVVAAAAATGTAEATTGAGAGRGAGTSDVAVLTALVALATGSSSSRGGVGGALTALRAQKQRDGDELVREGRNKEEGGWEEGNVRCGRSRCTCSKSWAEPPCRTGRRCDPAGRSLIRKSNGASMRVRTRFRCVRRNAAAIQGGDLL